MSEKDAFPRLLIISNACLSQNDSNGRTLRNFLVGWDKTKIAQFFVNNGNPDLSVCENYYHISDHDALQVFCKGAKVNGRIAEANEQFSISSGYQKKRKRNAITMLLREMVWNSKRWRKQGFYEWVNEFSPEVILLQAGDSPFMLKIAAEISKKYHAPLVIYNSEVYYFKKFDYFRARGIAHLLYPLFRKILRRQYKKTLAIAAKSVYCCEAIQAEYDSEFGRPSEAIYTATELKPALSCAKKGMFTVSYLGNLGVGRHDALIDIANVLQAISKDYRLDVYGKIPNEEVQKAFQACDGIRYKGFVRYEDVIQVMQGSHLLIHVENFSDFYREDLKYAFSTKIADSLASGTAFLLYAPQEMACAQYLTANAAAHVVNRYEDLEHVLRSIAENITYREQYLSSSQSLVQKNHIAEKNCERFQGILKHVVK